MDAKAVSLPSAAPAITTSQSAAAKPKPCCVCKDEKSKRDECMLFSKSNDPSKDCMSTIEQYKSCMKGFGFEI